MSVSAEVLAHFENREVKPTEFMHNNIKYLVQDILHTTYVDNPFFAVSGIKDRLYSVVTQDGTKVTLHWHRNTGDWTIERIFPA